MANEDSSGDNLLDIIIGATIKGNEENDMSKLLDNLQAIADAYETIADNQDNIDNKVLKDLINTLNGNPPTGINGGKDNGEVIDVVDKTSKKTQEKTEDEGLANRRETKNSANQTQKVTKDKSDEIDKDVTGEAKETRKLINEKIAAIFDINTRILRMMPSAAFPHMRAEGVKAQALAILENPEEWVEENYPEEWSDPQSDIFKNALNELGLPDSTTVQEFKEELAEYVEGQLNVIVDLAMGNVKDKSQAVKSFLDVLQPFQGAGTPYITPAMRKYRIASLMKEPEQLFYMFTGRRPRGSYTTEIFGKAGGEVTEDKLTIQQLKWIKLRRNIGTGTRFNIGQRELQEQWDKMRLMVDQTDRFGEWKNFLQSKGISDVRNIKFEKNTVMPKELLDYIGGERGERYRARGVYKTESSRFIDTVLSLSQRSTEEVENMTQNQLMKWLHENFEDLPTENAYDVLRILINAGLQKRKKEGKYDPVINKTLYSTQGLHVFGEAKKGDMTEETLSAEAAIKAGILDVLFSLSPMDPKEITKLDKYAEEIEESIGQRIYIAAVQKALLKNIPRMSEEQRKQLIEQAETNIPASMERMALDLFTMGINGMTDDKADIMIEYLEKLLELAKGGANTSNLEAYNKLIKLSKQMKKPDPNDEED